MSSKGKVAEAISAWLHDWPGVHVERNVRLPARHSRNRRREIDVLLHTTVAGYPVRLAIECKSKGRRVDAEMIDSFVGKLQDVGIPPQHGVFVSTSGFTSGAIERAQQDGVRTLMLRGLSADGLKAALSSAAYQSLVFLFPIVDQVTLFADYPHPSPPPLFVDAEGKLCGTVPHLLAAAWRDRRVPQRLGSHDVEVPVPTDWRAVLLSFRDVHLMQPRLYARFSVNAFAFTLEGASEQYSLVDPVSSRTEKVGLRASFPEIQGRHVLQSFETEEALAEFLQARPGVCLTQRIALPRIYYMTAFWPLSRRAADQMFGLLARQKDGLQAPATAPHPLIEGTDINAAWEDGMSMEEFDEVFLKGFSRRLAAHREMQASAAVQGAGSEKETAHE